MNSLDRTYFERLYAESDDPWAFETSPYEDEKYRTTVARLATRRYGRILEIGCSIGVLSERLAGRCDDLFSVDISATALARARERCERLPHVRFAEMTLPREFPAGPFDAIVLSEVGYYWSDADLGLARDRIAEHLAVGGTLVLVHFLPKVEDYVRDGDAVHEAFLGDGRFRRIEGERFERYRIDSLERVAESPLS